MSYKQLTQEERYQIKAYLKIGMTKIEIADMLGRHPTTIGRELKRNLGKRGYRPKQAHEMAKKRKSETPKAVKLTKEIKAQIITLLRQELSPEQVCI